MSIERILFFWYFCLIRNDYAKERVTSEITLKDLFK